MSRHLVLPFAQMGHVNSIHFIGVGGVGMAGIAEVLLAKGYQVSGSDVVDNFFTKRLRNLGATIYLGHHPDHVSNVDVVVRSSAVPAHNVELSAACALGTPVVPRAEMLGELMRFQHGIAVAGTHGKTTTTSLIAAILDAAHLDPTFVIGGQLNQFNASARLGSGKYLVAEADESDASFLYLNPMMAVLTNIDADHMSSYQHDFGLLEQTFIQFLRRLPFYGLAVLCHSDPVLQKLLPHIPRLCITYGLTAAADCYADNITYYPRCSIFMAHLPHREPLAITLNLPGEHNVLNSLAAIVVAHKLNLPDSAIVQALASFSGVGRRFQVYDKLALPGGGEMTMIDDYGHHPREISVTLAAINNCWAQRRLVMVFQPHRYSRTQDLFDDFCAVLAKPDVLLLLDVYAAGEQPRAGATSQELCDRLANLHLRQPILLRDIGQVPGVLSEVLRDGDVLLIQGAGNVGDLANTLSAAYVVSAK